MQLRSTVGRLAAGVAVITLCTIAALAAPPAAPVVLGIATYDAEKYNFEFQQYDRMIPVYQENGIRAALIERAFFHQRDRTEDQLVAHLKQFQVVHLMTTDTDLPRFDETHQRRAAVVGRALVRYVSEGGGLLLQPQPVRYPGTDVEVYWNAVLAPLGLQILHEGVFDKTRTFEGMTLNKVTFWRTRNIQAHAITKDVKQLCLPLLGHAPFPGVVAMHYSPEWEVLVRGEKEAKSYQSGDDNELNIELEGTYPSAPPVLAVRQLGKGRIACYPISPLFTGMNHRNPLWADIVEVNGDRAADQPSDSMRMQMNAYRWLAEPARELKDFGTYAPTPYQPIQYPAQVEFDRSFPTTGGFIPPNDGSIRGIFGAHSAYSDGKGTVAEYVAAARAAGLSFIVFNDPLELLTAETLARLKADCAAASKAGDFYACPGIEFTDGIGNRWAMWGERVLFPENTLKYGNREYVQWDGKRVRHFGQYAVACSYPGSALLDYRQLRANGGRVEKLWNFYHYLPFVYDKDRLVADNVNEYLFGLRDLRWASLASFTRIVSPTEVAAAAAACFSAGLKDMASVKQALTTRFAPGSSVYVSQGPVIAVWQALNGQMESNWKYTRGGQRVRLRFAVRSDAGIAEVKVLDADRGPIRRFLGGGARELAREFELVHDQQHYLVLEVTDIHGKKAISRDARLYCYKSGLYRCGDNVNILGPTAMVWHPDRNEWFNAAKAWRNGMDYSLRGWDSAGALGVLSPTAWLRDGVNLKETGGVYPNQPGLVPGVVMDVGVNNYDLQIVTMRQDKLSEAYNTDQRPTPYMATTPRDMADLEYYERVHTLYAPMERVDMFTTWSHRRDREGRKDYRGGILWHEGEIRFKKDCTLQGPVPIPLFEDRCPRDLAKNIGHVFVVTDVEGPRTGIVRDDKKGIRLQGRIRPGGYAAWMPTTVGYHGLLTPADVDLAYHVSPAPWSGLLVGLGRDGQQVKAGTVMKYRFGVGTFTDDVAGNALLEHTVKALNLGGGYAGYPVDMNTGTVEDAVFFFTARAEKNEAAFTLGPQNLMIDLPIRVRGLANNGCAAIYSTARPWYRFVAVDADGTAWLTEPIDKANAMWVGNVFVCDHREVKLTLVMDGQAAGKPPFLEVHNPTDREVHATISSPAHAPLFGGAKGTVKIPAGESRLLTIADGQLVPAP